VKPGLDRREFMRRTVWAGAGIAALGWPRRAVWAVEPAGAPVDPLRVVYYTDIHARVEWDTPEAMLQAAAAINRHQPDLVLCGGDMITDGFESGVATVAPRWEAYLAMHRAIRPAPEVVLGNHDLVGVRPRDGSVPAVDVRAEARARLGLERTYRAFTRGGYRFILLDSVQPIADNELLYRGFIDEAQMDWLRAELAALDPLVPIVLVCHMPLLTGFFQATGGVEAAVPANRGLVNNREVLEALAGHRLLLVLQGHLHVNEMMRWRGITFITGGAVCGRWWRGDWHGTGPGYGVLDLRGDRIAWQYHESGWSARRPDGV
jgi:3',5'-cyclic AMP phosphodiesterase CpdA